MTRNSLARCLDHLASGYTHSRSPKSDKPIAYRTTSIPFDDRPTATDRADVVAMRKPASNRAQAIHIGHMSARAYFKSMVGCVSCRRIMKYGRHCPTCGVDIKLGFEVAKPTPVWSINPKSASRKRKRTKAIPVQPNQLKLSLTPSWFTWKPGIDPADSIAQFNPVLTNPFLPG